MQFRDPTRVLGSGIAGVFGVSRLTRQAAGDARLIEPRNLRAGPPVVVETSPPPCRL